jgi:murein L,D-transpeptidase YcbB/YkuD
VNIAIRGIGIMALPLKWNRVFLAMTARMKSVALFSVLACASGGVAIAQAVAPVAATPPQAIAPATAAPATVPAAPAFVPLPPPLWDMRDAQLLLDYIQQLGTEGLNPAHYSPAGLAAAIQSRDVGLVSQAANDRFARVASDLALGYVPRKERKDWFIRDADLPAERLDALLHSAVQQHRVVETLNELLPTHPQYAALKNALKLSSAGETAKINRIKLNMERWRWLPRDLGERYVIVNVPGYFVTLVENGQTRWKQRAVAGAVRTPTPQISAMASGVILNPWWEVPKSIEPEVRGKAGYVPVKGKDGKVQRWRQPPGPSNALGQAKFVMPNSEAIFLHDTNARSKFNSQVRAFSHGCIRTQNILDLAAQLGSDDGGEWTREKIAETVASKKTVEAKFVKPLPVYIVYFSSAALNDGRIVDYNDMYARDGKVLAALQAPRGAAAKTEVATR